ncbi:MAG: methyltransferase domain-containing protein [Rhizobiales bacterium]|nr:methyltransferase domain-containing protein [Rhizobacter sp.]
MNLTLTERYLAGYHDTNPGATSRAFAALPVTNATVSFASTYEALIGALPADDAPQTVLDLACGDGHLLGLLAGSTRPHTLIGVDLSAGELAAARTRLGARATLLQGKAQQLPLTTASVDAVVSHLALMLMDDAETVITELHRVLRPGGTLVGVVGARPSPNPALEAFVRLYPAASQRAEFSGIRFGDRRFRSQGGITELLAAGFDSLHFETLTLARDCTPEELWDWFSDTYDTDLLTPAALADFRRNYLLALQPLCGSLGTMKHEDRYQLFSAKARA